MAILDFATRNRSLANELQVEAGVPAVEREGERPLVSESVPPTVAGQERPGPQAGQVTHRVFSASWRTYQCSRWKGGLIELKCAAWVKAIVLSLALWMLLATFNLTFGQLLRALDLLTKILSSLIGYRT